MRRALRLPVLVLVLAGCLPRPAAAAGQEIRPAEFITAIDRMMAALGPQSASASATIRDAYHAHLDLLFLNGYRDLEGALATGGLALLPADAGRYNLSPRLGGLHPIGEKDLGNQGSYVAARPATIGCLLAVAARVHSGPVEVTSLVRHGEYQDALKGTNANATTSVPMHTMGLAFDIALLNSSLETAYEIRNVLSLMRDAGDLLFIGERKQLVFHVVPHPSRLGYFNDLYMSVLGAPPAERAVQVVAPAPPGGAPAIRDRPRVLTEILAVVPAGQFPAPVAVRRDAVRAVALPAVAVRAQEVPADAAPARRMLKASVVGQVWLVILAGMLATACRVTAPAPVMARLFRRTGRI